MRQTQKILTGIAALLCASPILMTACANAEKTDALPSVTEKETKSAVTEADTDNPRAAYAAAAPAVEDFGNYAYRMAVLKDNALVFKQVGYWTEEQNGDTLNDAIYLRNRAVEEAYNIKLSLIELEDTNAVLRKNIQASDDFADIVFPSNIGELMTLAQQGCFWDLNTVEELQLKQPWWDQRIQDSLTVFGQLFCITGDIQMRDELREMSVLYNKKVYEEYDYPDPYEFVSNGTWTWEQLSSMVRDVTKDLDGNGKLDVADKYGLISENIAGWYLFLASGKDVIRFDGSTYIADIQNQQSYDIFENLFKLLCDKNAVIIMDDGTHANEITTVDIWTEATKIFSENRALFRTGTFGDSVDLRDMKTDFGVLPIPKYDESQDGYYCMVHNDSMPLVIPTTVPDLHKTALITEALGYESMFTLTPSFYEVFLDEKILRDEQSKAMIDILFDSKVYSLDYMCTITGMQTAIANIVSTGKSDTLSSKTASIQKSAQKKLDKYMKKFEELE
ncbi:MAG: extracellular solute-binding protein [Clostridia bacterium]|nr:extracellular solute-binding protein [Clostridia bacterium]